MGGIGRNVKRKAEAFGMEVVYHNRKRLPEKEEAGARYVEFEELLGKSDALSLNLPLNVSAQDTNLVAPRQEETDRTNTVSRKTQDISLVRKSLRR